MEAFAPTVPHFFKVILEEDIKRGKLVVPKKFVRKYGTNLCKSNLVVLKVPTGDSWEVQLRASKGVFRLENGWPEFLKFYTIQHGDFFVFRYESRSSNELDVVVCDKTCTEVEYPRKAPVNMSLIKVEDVREDDVIAVEETPELQPSRGTARRKTHLRTRKNPPSKTNVRSKDPSSSAKGTRGIKLKSRSEGRGQGRSGLKVRTEDEGEENGCIEICGGDTEVEEEEGREPAGVRAPARVGRPSSSTKKRNPYFEKSLMASNMKFFTLPAAAATEAEQWTKTSAVIRDSGGREWPVAVKHRTCGYNRLDLSTGWADFIRGTGLSPGHTVRFEFLGGRTNVIEARVLGRAPVKKVGPGRPRRSTRTT